MNRAGTLLTLLTEVYTQYPHIKGGKCSGLTVGSDIPNTASIAATLDNYEVLKGVREIPFTEFSDFSLPSSKDDLEKVKNLANQIKSSGRIDPLIIVVDEEGPYVLEGSHRFYSLHLMKLRSFPAIVVIDRDVVDSENEDDEETQIRHERDGIEKEREQKNLKLWSESVPTRLSKASKLLESLMRKISSQRYLDHDTVEEKRKSKDYTVDYVILDLGDEKVMHIVDGHHSLEAAKLDGVEPEYRHQKQIQQEADNSKLDDYLAAHFIDSDWFDLDTGKLIF